MAWTIDSWSRETGTGTIRSPHFAPIPFAPSANIDGVSDFALGEEVVVELVDNADDFLVRSLRPMRQRQPPNTQWPPFDAINYQFGDAHVENLRPDSLQLWLGDCCQYCCPDALRLRFEGVSTVRGLDQECDFDAPLFRLASSDEVREFALDVPPGQTPFCIVTSHGRGPDGPRAFVVAQRTEIIRGRDTAAPAG